MNYLADYVEWRPTIPLAVRVALCDAQTSGGLLIAVPPKRSEKLLAALRQFGCCHQRNHLGTQRAYPSYQIGDYIMPEETNVKRYLFVINEAPYGNERSYNALRLALNIIKRPGVSMRLFLIGDGVFCARRGQKTPDGYYNIERMIKALVNRGEVAT
jgi:hypothetical protein